MANYIGSNNSQAVEASRHLGMVMDSKAMASNSEATDPRYPQQSYGQQ